MADETSSASSAFSPLSGGYLLIVLSEPHSEQHKQVLLEHLAKGLASWDSVGTQIDIESELRNIATQCPNGEEVRNGEKLIQLASDSLVTEILIQPQLSTLKQCMRNLLASFTRHRHVIHAGYTLSGPGSWILQDGTYDFGDFMHIVQDPEIQRLYRAYESSITMDLHCADEGQWSAEQINQDPAIKAAKISINPPGRLSAAESQSQQDAVNSFIRYISDILPSVTLDHLLEPSDVVGNIRFNHPTLYVFPGGQGDSALFGISGFNILVDGGFGRKPCFWDFTRHLDRLDAVVMTRSNASSLSGLTGAICRKAASPVYPQMGHIFCNLPRDGEVDLGDIDQQINAADSTSESLTVNINDLCRAMSAGLEALQLKAQPIYRSATLEPINLYHKVGHGTLDMFIVSPSANSLEVKELMRLWRSGDVSTAFRTIKMGGKEFRIPLLDIVSVCALLVWQPADPNEPVTRLLFPGSAPQHKILEGLEKFRQLEFLKSPVFMAKDVAAPPSAVITPSSTSSAFTKSPVKTKSTSSPRHTPIEPVPVKASAVRKEVSSKPPTKAADHSGSNVNSKEADAKPRPAPKVIKADVLSSSSRTGSTELRAKKAEAKPTTAAPIKSTTTTTAAKKETAMSVNGETNKTLAPKIKKDVANMKMVEARVHSFKSSASLKRAEEITKNKKPGDDKDIKDKVQRSQSQSREKRSASTVRGQPADEDKTRVKLVKKIAPSTTEATPVSPAKTMTKPIKAKPKETSKPAEPKAPVAKEPLKKDKPAAPKPKPAAAKETPKPAPKAPAASSSSSTPSGKAVKRPVKAAAAAAAVVGAAAAVVAVAAVTTEEQPTEEQPAVVEEDFNAAEAPQAASSPKQDTPTEDGGQVPDEPSVLEAIESQILEDVEAVEQQSQHDSEPDPANAEDEVEEQAEEQAEGSVAGEVADADEAEESAEKDEEEVVEADEEEIAQVEDGGDEGVGSEEPEVADVVISEEVVQTEDAEADAETEDAEVAVTDEVVEEVAEEVAEEVTEEVAEEVAEEVTEEVKEKTDDEEVKEKTDDEEETVPETVEPEEFDEKSANDKEEVADVEENEKPDDVVDVQDEEELANEAEERSIDNEVAVDVAQVDQRSNDQDDNLETDECPEPVEEEEIQSAVSSTSVDAGRPKSASPQPVASGDEMANVSENDIIDQIEQSHNLDATQEESPKEQVEELQEPSEEKEVADKKDENVEDDKVEEKDENLIEDQHEEIATTSPEPVEEEIQPAVSSQSVETSKPLSPSPQPQPEEHQDDNVEDVDRETEVEEEEKVHQEESSLEHQTIDKELDEEKDKEEDDKQPDVVASQLSDPCDSSTTEEIQSKESADVVSEKVDNVEKEEEIDDQHDIEKRQSHELTVESTGHQEDALSSLSSLSDLEPTPVLDRSGASLYEEEQQLSSMESQPESHQFTQKSAPQMEESSPKDMQQTTKSSSLAVVDDESSGPSSVEVEEEFKAEIVVRPVPISVPLDVVDFVAPHQPAPSPPVVKSPVKEIPTPLVLDEEDDGVEVEEEAFQQEIKTKDSAVPITPVEEDQGASSFSYEEPQGQSENRQLPSSQFNSDKKEESAVDGTAVSRSKEAEAEEFRASIDNQYGDFMKTPATEEKSKQKTPEEKPSTETTVEKKQPEEKCEAAVEKKTEEKISSPLEAKCAAVEEKKSEEVKKTTPEVKPAEKDEEEVEEEIVSKVVDNKSVKAEKVEESSVKEVAKSPETRPLDESDILEMIVGDIVTEKVEVSTTDDKSVKVSVDLEAEVVKTSEPIVESFQAVDSESTKSTKDADSHESFLDKVKNFVEDVKSSFVEDVKVSKMDTKPVESQEKEKVSLEETKEVFKKEELSIAVHAMEAEAHPTEDIEKKDVKDSIPEVPIQTADTKSVKFDEVEVPQVSGKEKGFIEEVVQKICSVELIEKVSECLTKEKESTGMAAKEEEEESVPVFEKCEKYGKTEKDVLAVVEPMLQATTETVVLSAEVKSQRSSTSEAAPLELELDIPERKLSNVSASSVTSVEKDAIVEAVVSEIKTIVSESEKKMAIIESEIKSATIETEIKLAAIEAEIESVSTEAEIKSATIETEMKSATIDAEIKSVSTEAEIKSATIETEIKSATIESDIKSVSTEAEIKSATIQAEIKSTTIETEVKLAAIETEIKSASTEAEMKSATIESDIKSVDSEPVTDTTDLVFVAPVTASSPIDGPELLKELTFPQGLPSKSETDSSLNSLVDEIKETIQDVKASLTESTTKSETDSTPSKDKVEDVKQILADVKETFKLESDNSSKSQVEEIKEIIHADVKATLESAPKSETVCHSEDEEVRETVADVRKASLEMTFDADLAKPKMEEVKEIISDARKASLEMAFDADLTKPKMEEVKEVISDLRKKSLEMTLDADLTKLKVEEAKEVISDVRKASVEMEIDADLPKSKVEEVKEIISDVRKASVEMTIDADLSKPKAEEAKEIISDVRKASLEMTIDANSPTSKVEEIKEIVADAKKASVETASKSEADLHKPQVEEIKEIIQDVKEAVESMSKSESVIETQVQQVKEMSFESSSKSETEVSCKSKLEEAKEIIPDVKKTEELALKCESIVQETQVQQVKEMSLVADCDAHSGLSSKVEEVKETIEDVKKMSSDLFASKKETVEEVKEVIHDVKETSSSAVSKVAEVAESLSKLEAKVEVKAVTPEPEVIPQAASQLKCDPLANLPVVALIETSKNVVEEVKPKCADLAKLDVVDKTEQLKPETIDCSNVSCSSSTSVTPKTPLSPNIARREVAVESTVIPAAANLESFAAPPPTRFGDDVRDVSQPSSLDSMEVHSNSSTSLAGAEKQHEEDEDEDVAATSLTPTINYLAAGYEGVSISTASKLSTIASSDGETDGAQPPSLDSNWSSKTFDKLTLAAESGARHQPEESAFSSGPSSWDDREPGARPYYVVSESISDRSATSSIISHATDDDYPAEKLDRPSLVSHVEPRSATGELNIKKELDVAPVSPVPSSPFSTDRCSSHGDFEANKDSLSSIQTSESSDFHLETKVDDSASAISSTRSDYSDDRSGSSVDPTLLQQQRLEQRSLTPRSDISCSSETTDPVTTANTTQLIQPGQQQTPVDLKANSKAELADPKLAPHNIWLKEKDTASSPNPFTDQYVDDDTDHSEPLASSTLYYQQQQQPPVQQHHQQHLSDFESDRHSDSQSSSVPVAEYTDEYYVQHLDYVETTQKSSHPHPDEASDQEAYLYESEHDDQDHHYHPYATKYSDSYDEADLYPTEEAINDDYRHIGDHQNGNSYHYYESGESATTEEVVGNLHGQYEDLNRNDRTPTRDVQHPYVAPDVYESEPAVISPTSRQLDVTTAATTSSSRDERVLPQTSPLPSPQPHPLSQQLSPQQQQQQQQHEDTLASWGKPLGLPAPVAPGVVFSSNGSNGSPLKRPATATNNGHKASDKAANGANNAASAPFYVDLAYIPHHSDPRYSDVDFFKRIRARHYVLSTLEPSAQVLDALLEGKQSWTGDDKDLDVTIIPTYDSDTLATWVSANEDLLARNRIDLAPSASRCTINLQDHETSCSAYRLEF